MDPRRQRTIDALLHAAEALFAEHSVDEVTVEQIAAAAGVAVSSIYNHFGSKAGLHAAIVQRALDTDRDFMDRAYVAGRSPIDQLYAAADQYLEFYLRYPEYFRMLAFPAGPGQYAAGASLAAELAASVDEQNERMVTALDDAIAAGELRPVDPREVATVLWSAWNGIISLGWRPDRLHRSPEELRALLKTATDVVAEGLLPRR
ncbi:MAG TPA: TetR/AcrR family transcriptional regulator [Jatrophihabitantaceae bacterium]|nr:TetR/AcrR family transcriptional regulator [Jatrophihabitantaceae bacterium]